MNTERLEKLMIHYRNNPDDPFLNHAIGIEHARNDDVLKATEYFEKVVKIDPGYVGTYYHLGKAYEKLGKAENAERVYRKGMEVAKTNSDQHALAELQQAYQMFLDSLNDE